MKLGFIADCRAVADVLHSRSGMPNFCVHEEELEQIIRQYVADVPQRDICAQLGKSKSYYPIIKSVLDEYEQGV